MTDQEIRPGWAEAERIDVDDLGEAVPPPFAAEAEAAEAGPPPAPLDLTPAEVADRLVPLLRAPFSIAGLALSRRYPLPAWRDAVVQLWQVSEAEVRPIADALAPVIPAHWLVERALAASPWGAAGMQAYVLVTTRLEGTASIAAQWEEQQRGATQPPPAGIGAATRPAGGNGTSPDERGPVPASDRHDGYEGAGLGV